MEVAMKKTFNRRIYTFFTLHKDIWFLLKNSFAIVAAFLNKKIDKAFMERIMLVTTAVNGCTYCSWFHAKQAAATGMSATEIKDILSLQFKTQAAEEEVTALLFAQHYAETNRHPDPEMWDKLNAYYGVKNAYHLYLMIRIIYFANLSGNTYDAFLSRLKGEKASGSNVLFEIVFFILNTPFLLPLVPFTKKMH